MTELMKRIAAHPFFTGMESRVLPILLVNAKEEHFPSGQIIFREGEPANRFFLIEKGQVAIEAHEPADGTFPIEELGPGDVLGWSWLLSPFVWHFQARAVQATDAIVLDGAHLLVTAEQNSTFGYELLRRIAHTLIHRLQATRQRYIDRELEAILKG